MTTRTQMVARLRQELGDEATPYIWTDAYLHNLIIEANDWYSRLYPYKSIAFKDVALGARLFALGVDFFTVLQVECPAGNLLPEDSSTYSADPTAYGGALRQSYSVFGGNIYLRNAAAGEEVGAAHLVVFVQLSWDRPDPILDWNGPSNDERLLELWAAREAWLWHDGQSQRLQRKVGQFTQAQRFGGMLDEELGLRARRSSFYSRTMEVSR